jgi:hypothetical protein
MAREIPEKLSGGVPGAPDSPQTYQQSLDDALAQTFPASDPISPTQAMRADDEIPSGRDPVDWHLKPGSEVPPGTAQAAQTAASHPIGAPIGAIAGAATGALIGVAAGPVGSLAGAVVGAVAGASLGGGGAPNTQAPSIRKRPQEGQPEFGDTQPTDEVAVDAKDPEPPRAA